MWCEEWHEWTRNLSSGGVTLDDYILRVTIYSGCSVETESFFVNQDQAAPIFEFQIADLTNDFQEDYKILLVGSFIPSTYEDVVTFNNFLDDLIQMGELITPYSTSSQLVGETSSEFCRSLFTQLDRYGLLNSCEKINPDYREERVHFEECKDGDFVACDLLWTTSLMGSASQRLAASCNGLHEAEKLPSFNYSFGNCAYLYNCLEGFVCDLVVPERMCIKGLSNYWCDVLFVSSMEDSEQKEIGLNCGLSFESYYSDFPKECVIWCAIDQDYFSNVLRKFPALSAQRM